MKIIFSGKRNLRLSEHIVFQHIVAAQFQFHAGSVSFQKVLRIVLTGKTEFLNNCNCYIQSCKNLSLYLFFQFKDMLLMNPAFTFYIHPYMSSGRIAGHSGHKNHVQQFFQFFLHF